MNRQEKDLKQILDMTKPEYKETLEKAIAALVKDWDELPDEDKGDIYYHDGIVDFFNEYDYEFNGLPKDWEDWTLEPEDPGFDNFSRSEYDWYGDLICDYVCDIGQGEDADPFDQDWEDDEEISTINRLESEWDGIETAKEDGIEAQLQGRIKKMHETLEDNEDLVECQECFDLFPKADCFKVEYGYLCPHCHKLVVKEIEVPTELVDEAPFDLDFPKPVDFDDDGEECENCGEEPTTEVVVAAEVPQDVADNITADTPVEVSISAEPENPADAEVFADDEMVGAPAEVPAVATEADVPFVAEFHDDSSDSEDDSSDALIEHVQDRPEPIEDETEYQGVDNQVVPCETTLIVSHSEDEKPLDCKMEKPALEEPVAGKEVEVKLTESTFDQELIDFARNLESLEHTVPQDLEDDRTPEPTEEGELSEPVNADEVRKHEKAINESQAQEIGALYKKLSDLYHVDLEELVYGEDGFMKSCYPEGFPDFAGDVIYNSEYWDEFENWLRDTKGIELTEELKEIPLHTYRYFTDPHGLEGEVEALSEEDAYKEIILRLSEKGIYVPDELVDLTLVESLNEEVLVEFVRPGKVDDLYKNKGGYYVICRDKDGEEVKNQPFSTFDNAQKFAANYSKQSGNGVATVFAKEGDTVLRTFEDGKVITDAIRDILKQNKQDAKTTKADNKAEEKEEQAVANDAGVKPEENKPEEQKPAEADQKAEEEKSSEEKPAEEKQVEPSNAKLNRQRLNNKKIVKALNELGIDISKLVVDATDKNGRKYKKASPELNKLRKELFAEAFDFSNSLEERAMTDVPFDSEAQVGDKIRIVHLEGEGSEYDGREGEVLHIDGIGQLHGTWGGLAVIPGVDEFEIINGEELEEASSAEKKAFNDGGQAAQDYIQGKAIARIKDPAAKDAAIAAAKAGRPDAVKMFTGERHEQQADAAFDKKMKSMSDAMEEK